MATETPPINTCFEDILRTDQQAAASSISDYISAVLREQGGTRLGPVMLIEVPLTAEMVNPKLYPSSDRRLVAARVVAEIMTKAFTFAPVLNPQLTPHAKDEFVTPASKLDGKFHGTVFRHADQTVVPEDQWIVFLAKDNAFPATLQFYREECERIGAAPEQLAAVDRLITRVKLWRLANPDKLKIPDAAVGECH